MVRPLWDDEKPPPPPTLADQPTVCYRGGLAGAGGVTVEQDDGTVIGPLTHWQRYSPTGFRWGYDGQGPSELARCLLIDVLGVDAHCPTCAGRGTVTFHDGQPVPSRPGLVVRPSLDGAPRAVSQPPELRESKDPCPVCFDGWRVDLPVSELTAEVVAGLDMIWSLTSTELRDWYAPHAPPPPPPPPLASTPSPSEPSASDRHTSPRKPTPAGTPPTVSRTRFSPDDLPPAS